LRTLLSERTWLPSAPLTSTQVRCLYAFLFNLST
jgi:hypothetical protein